MSSEPTLSFLDTFETTGPRLRDIVKDVKLNKDAVITVKTEPKKAVFLNTGKYKFRHI
jgi:hypothetical protein